MHCLFKIVAAAIVALPLVASSLASPFCNISLSTLAPEVPTNLTAVIPPANVSLIQVVLGVGTQNYTCQNSKYVSVGALATLFDVSCLQPIPSISGILAEATEALQTQDNPQLFKMLFAVAELAGFKVGDHYFDTTTGPLAPVFKFAASGQGFIIGKKIVDLPAPVDPTTNVDWLQLSSAAGILASFVMRDQTAGGQPPSSCAVENENLQVPYAAKYWFFK